MNTKSTIRKFLFITMWVVIGGGMLTLLIAAMGRERKDVCRDYTISIQGVKGEELFLDEKDILKLLKAATRGNVKGQPRSAFDLANIEQLLAGNQWVSDAQLYFDNNNVLHVTVKEREPVARIFTAGGRSFYFDAGGQQMQLADNIAARLPVFTGFPDKKITSKADSVLVSHVCEIAKAVQAHSFWSAQAAQIDVVNTGPGHWEFDMVPLIGSHLIKLGDAKDIDKKLEKLLRFYKEVLAKSGFSTYKIIDARFKGQIVAAKSENPKVDAAELRKAVERMLQQVKEAEQDGDVAVKPATTATVAAPVASKQADKPTTDSKTTTPKPAIKTDRKEPKETERDKKPKAVMPKKNRGGA